MTTLLLKTTKSPKASWRLVMPLLFTLLFSLCLEQTTAQVTYWVGGVSTDYFNKNNWSDNTINFASLGTRTLIVGAGNPYNCIHAGGNASNTNYRANYFNTTSQANFTVKGALYSWNNDSLNGNITVSSPADFNLRSAVAVGRNGQANLNITGGKISSRLAFSLASGSAGSSATVMVSGGSLNAGTDLNVANGAGLTASLKITGGAVNVPGNLNIGAGGSVFISGIGLLKLNGDKRTAINNHIAGGKITCTAGKTLAVNYDGSATSVSIPQDPNGLLTEYPEYIILKNEYLEARIEKWTSNITSLKVNGVETLNTAGTSRKGTYYDFTTSKGFETIFGATFSVKTEEDDIVDVSFKRPYTPGSNVTPCDADIHYVLKRGDTGIYTYSILEHKAEYPTFDMGSWRQVMWIASDPKNTNNYLTEKIYVDSIRNWQMPSLYDFSQASSTGIAEIVKLNTGVQAGTYDGKYEYATPSFWQDLVYGHASDVNNIGSWFVYGSPEFFNEGPTYHELNAAAGIIHSCMNGVHYNSIGMTVNQGEYWSKIYGPYLIYTSTKATGDLNWADAKARVEKEKAEWPYSWLTNTAQYPLKEQRGSVSGKFIINDPFKPEVKGQNAWVGVTILNNPANQWQQESKNYQYWVKTDAEGNFTIPNVRPGTYSFFGYSDGVTGDYSQQNVTVTAGGVTNLGDVTWNIARDKGSLVFEIGVPNRTADEFKFGHREYMEGFAYNKFADNFTNIIEYNAAEKNWGTALPYAHSPYIGANGSLSQWKWRINFNLPANTPLTGNATLNIAYAGADHAQQWIYVNGESKLFSYFYPDNGGGNALLRQSNYAKYSTKSITIPMSRLKIGENTITLLMPSTSYIGNHLMYDYISLEANIPTKEQSITFSPIADKVLGEADLDSLASASSGLAVSYSSSDTTVAVVMGDKIRIVGAGSSKITAFQSGNEEYLPADSVSQMLTVVPDTIPPTIPGDLTAMATDSTVTLNWTASTDFIGVTGYKIYKDGVLAGTSTGTSFMVTGLSSSVTYAFTVVATDNAGNVSDPASIQVTTPDTQAPSVPQNLVANKTTAHQVSLSWTVSTDNVGVVGYNIYQNGVQLNTSLITGTVYVAERPIGYNLYEFTVKAVDAAGNSSLASNAARVQNGQAGDKARVLSTSNVAGLDLISVESVSVYPNPSNGNFKVNLNSAENGKVSISVYNVNGVLVKSINDIKTGAYEKEIKLQELSAGTYVIRISLNGFVQSKTIIIQ